MRRTRLAVSLILALVLFLLPAFVPAEADGKDAGGGEKPGEETTLGTATSYPVWVQGVQVTSENMNDVLGDGTVSYVPAGSESASLTLNKAKLANALVENQDSAIIANEALNVVVEGSNTITLTRGANAGAGIDGYVRSTSSEVDISVTGSGNLAIEVKQDGTNSIYGIFGKNVTIDGPSVDITIPAGGLRNTGIYASGDVYIGNADLRVFAD